MNFQVAVEKCVETGTQRLAGLGVVGVSIRSLRVGAHHCPLLTIGAELKAAYS